MHISQAFDSGNIEVIDASDPSDVQLAVRMDAGNEHLQWFHFRVSGAAGTGLNRSTVRRLSRSPLSAVACSINSASSFLRSLGTSRQTSISQSSS